MALTPQQQKHRSERITSTRAPAIVGCDPDKSLHGAAREILGIDDEVIVTGPMERGNFMEEGIARWFSHRTGMKLRKARFIVHPEFDFFGDSSDYIALGDDEKPLGVVECKNYLSGKRWEYGEPGSDEVDQRTYIQSVWHMAHHGLPRCWVPLAVYDLDVYLVPRDRELEEAVLHKCRDFYDRWIAPNLKVLDKGGAWQDCELPPVDGKDGTTEWIKNRYHQKVGDLVPGDDVSWRMAVEHKRLTDQIKELDEKKAEIANQLKLMIGERYGIDFEERGRVTWSQVKGKAVTDYKAVLAELGPVVTVDLLEKHTRITEGHRALRCNPKESK